MADQLESLKISMKRADAQKEAVHKDPGVQTNILNRISQEINWKMRELSGQLEARTRDVAVAVAQKAEAAQVKYECRVDV